MIRKSIVSGLLIGTLFATGCANMSDTERRVTTGAALGGVAAGVISGEWGWAAAGAAAGAAGGYLYDKNRQNEQKAYDRGVQDGRKRQ